jgi:hypothetical protein
MQKPNLEYINRLSRGDKSIKAELIEVIKTEFPKEKKEYYESLEKREFKKIEENVHTLSILGLEKSYEIANQFEHNLREHSLDKKEDFDKILIAIADYIETI